MREPLSRGPYGKAAIAYTAGGWPCPVPVTFGEKYAPVDGFTGAHPAASGADVHEWTTNGKASWNIAIRPSATMVGIDVDHYGAKRGGDTLADLEARLGPLPPTVVSSRRLPDNTVAGIRWFVLPPGVTTDNWPATLGSGIDVIRHGHRYGMVAPSYIAKDDSFYRWLDQRTGEVTMSVPPCDLATLPQVWCDHVAGLRSEPSARSADEKILASLDAEQQAWLDRKVEAVVERIATAQEGGREEAFNNGTLELGHYARFLDEAEVHRRVLTACKANGYLADHSDFAPKWKHAWADGALDPWNPPISDDAILTPLPTPTPAPQIEPTFWKATPVLDHIRQAAHSYGFGSLSVLGAVLARVSMLTHYSIELPEDPNRGSLNIFVGMVGRSGGGKGSSVSIATRLLPAEPLSCECRDPEHRGDYVVVPPGSGEGLVRTYFDVVSEVGPDGKKRTATKRDRRHVLVNVDEIETLMSTMGRTGATIGGVLRSLWSGATPDIGNNASSERRLLLGEGTYRAALVAGIQPGVVGRLFGEEMGGTPQRFVWAPTDDPAIPNLDEGEEFPPWPGALPPVRLEDQGRPWHHFTIEVDESVRREIALRRNRDRRGVERIAPLDAHRDFNRLRVAALLARLHGETAVTPQWWALAGHVMDVSDATRQWMLDEVAQSERRRAEKRAYGRAIEAQTVEELVDAKTEKAVKRIAKRLWGKVAGFAEAEEDPTATVSANDLKKALASRDRKQFDDALEYAVESKMLVEHETPDPRSPDGVARSYGLGEMRPA